MKIEFGYQADRFIRHFASFTNHWKYRSGAITFFIDPLYSGKYVMFCQKYDMGNLLSGYSSKFLESLPDVITFFNSGKDELGEELSETLSTIGDKSITIPTTSEFSPMECGGRKELVTVTTVIPLSLSGKCSYTITVNRFGTTVKMPARDLSHMKELLSEMEFKTVEYLSNKAHDYLDFVHDDAAEDKAVLALLMKLMGSK